jgi:hypothetical protein
MSYLSPNCLDGLDERGPSLINLISEWFMVIINQYIPCIDFYIYVLLCRFEEVGYCAG